MTKNETAPKKIKHVLAPEHFLTNEKEKKELLTKYGISITQLPKILISDPAIAHLNAKIGDVVRIDRFSYTMGKTNFYRVVVNA